MSSEFWEDEALANIDAMRTGEDYDGRYEDIFDQDNFPSIKNNGESTSTMINGLPKCFKDNVPF